MAIPAKTTSPPTGDVMEQVLLKGDLAKLTPEERVRYYNEVCRSIGLNPLTKPFEYITLNGKLQLYALRACTDQLRKINHISLEIVSQDIADEILTVHVRARDGDGRVDEDLGSVSFPSTLKGDNRANATLKCVTKAKRRATLSICGLGWLDETEVADIPANGKRSPPKPAPDIIEPPHDSNTGEVVPPDIIKPPHDPLVREALATLSPHDDSNPEPEPEPGDIPIQDMAREAAERGAEVMKKFYLSRSKTERVEIDKIRPELDILVDAAERDANDMGS